MYCGSCLRDNALATELLSRGHQVTLLPVYTPTLTDEVNVSQDKVFSVGSVSILNNTFRHFGTLQNAWIASGILRLCFTWPRVVRSPQAQKCLVK
jgi:hypothetical protein